jgi:hypothetical protein
MIAAGKTRLLVPPLVAEAPAFTASLRTTSAIQAAAAARRPVAAHCHTVSPITTVWAQRGSDRITFSGIIQPPPST